MTLSISQDGGAAIAVSDGHTELFRYTYVPDTPQFESPKPYLHPLRTRAGHLVSLFRPHDHVWHKGIAWSLPVVGDENFWGGPTYVRDQGYVQLPNDGAQAHLGVEALAVGADGVARFAHDLEWITQAGDRLFTERRAIGARVVGEDSWVLTVETAMKNVSASDIAIGSPTTKGRDNAGYGGLFWRGPRSFTGGTLVTASGTGSGNDVRGQRHEWMGFAGRQDEVDASSLIVMVDDVANPHHPPQWFARSEEFACLNPAPFFSEELVVPAGGTVEFRYGVGIADADADAAAALAQAVRDVLGGQS
ncbi:PmoA family protein [Microbacterium pumilum]|uniref:PmoA family protein n=1 Tax=Microbacterium pumilum TaxID=344165 RepID=A0ABN2RRT9_9MICO